MGLIAGVVLFSIMTAVLVVTDTTGLMFTSPISFSSSSSSSNVNYLVGSDYMWGDDKAPGSCEEDGCGKSDFLPTEDCGWGDATWPKDEGDQQGQKPGCTFCYESRDGSYASRKKLHKLGVCKFKLPIGADCTIFESLIPNTNTRHRFAFTLHKYGWDA